MQQAGDEVLASEGPSQEILAIWREAGEWWRGESPREFRRFVDHMGIRREEEKALILREGSFETVENRVARVLRSRDDKVEHMSRPKPMPDMGTYGGDQKPCALLHLQSGYAYGRSTLFAETIPMIPDCQAYSAVLLADPFSLSGALEFGGTKADSRLRPLIGSTFEMEDGGELVLVARTQKGYRSLSHLITDCHLGEPRLFPLCNWNRLEKYSDDLLCLSGGDGGPLNRHLVRGQKDEAVRYLDRLIGIYGRENVFLQIERCYLPWERGVNRQLLELAEQMKVVPVAGGPVTHRHPEHFPAQDMLVCIETLCGIDEVIGRKPTRDPSQPSYRTSPKRALNGERYLRSPYELAALFADRRDLVLNTMRVAERCDLHVLPNRTELPQFCEDERGLLRKLVEEHGPFKGKRKIRVEYELERISSASFGGHFLVAWDMCRWAKEQGIILSGRGSVVDSVVAYYLGLSRIDAFEHNLHFDRFLPKDGSKRPDIDIDFEARRRDDIRNYLASKYGEAHVATVGAFGTYGTRGIIREVGKVMGIPEENVSYLTKRLHGSVTPERLEQAIESKPELRDSNIPRERFRWVFRLAEVLMELPRNLRSHSSGVVISREPIVDTVPIVHSGVEGVKIIQWDKRTTKHFFDKFDVLCLRGNDVLSDTQERVRQQSASFSVEKLELDDEEVFRAMRSGQLIGVPQSASPAMRQAHIRLETRNLKDASIVQAAIRPGVGGAVNLNLLIQRRKGLHHEYIHEELERILKPTWGVIVFQEQVDQLLQTFGGYTSGEAEELREAIYKRRREEHVASIKDQIISGILKRGFSQEIAEVVYGLVSLFQGYGFAEGHALAFADISIRSIHCQQNFPAEYFSALFDAQPAGYYGPCTLANEARARGVKILPPSVNRSLLKYRVEDVRADTEPTILMPNAGIRVSLQQISGLSKDVQEAIVREREAGDYSSFFDFVSRVRPPRDELELLVLCGALDELHPNRRTMLWAIPSAIGYAQNVAKMVEEQPNRPLSLVVPEPDFPIGLSDFSVQEKAIYERRILDMDVEFHLMQFERERVKAKGILTAIEAGSLPNKTKAFVVGNPIRLRFPPTASGKRVLFFDLEDETGLLNVTCFNETYLRDGHKVICCPYVTILGEAQERDGHIAFLASRIHAYHPILEQHLNSESPLPVTTADFLVS